MAYEKQNFEDGKVLKAEQLNKMDDQIKKNTPLIVTISEDGATASHTATEIYEHLQAGGVARLNTGNIVCNLSHCNDGFAYFIEFCDDFVHYVHMVNESGKYELIEMAHAPQEALGDISTALDEIIAIQESLIGGESA